jgi:hypothetical protein
MIDRAFGFFFLSLLVLTFLLGLGAFQFSVTPPSFTKPILLGLASVTMVIFFLLKSVKKEHQQTFVMYYLLSIFLKFLLAGVAAFLILKLDAHSANSNVVFFMISYVAYTTLEIGGLLMVKK